MRCGELVPIDSTARAALGGTGHLKAPAAAPRNWSHILSPFDPLMIQRHLFFDYEHRFDGTLRRQSGCSAISLPDLRLVTVLSRRSNLETNRKNRKLLVQKWSWVGARAAARAEDLKRRIEQELHRLNGFNWRNEADRASIW